MLFQEQLSNFSGKRLLECSQTESGERHKGPVAQAERGELWEAGSTFRTKCPWQYKHFSQDARRVLRVHSAGGY